MDFGNFSLKTYTNLSNIFGFSAQSDIKLQPIVLDFFNFWL
jgi:hypothetical protein